MNTLQVNAPQGNILVVDDTPENLRLLSDLLTEQGYKVRSVTNGQTALRAADAKPPDLILLDINMPQMNGYEVCEKLKASEETCEIPVIFLSALNEALDKVKAFSVGGSDYITKPFQIEEVLVRVENQLRFCKAQKLLAEQNILLENKNTLLEQEVYERKLAQAALESSESKNRSLLSAIPDLMFRISADGIFLDYRDAKDNLLLIENKTFQGGTENTGSHASDETLSVTDSVRNDRNFVGKTIFEVLSNDFAVWAMRYVEQTLLTNEIQIGEYVRQNNDNYRYYETRYVASGSNEVLAIVRDISERKYEEAARLQSEALLRAQTQRLEQALNDLKQAQSQLVQNEKMVALGQLIAGIAHEINNPVSFIYGNLTPASQYIQDLLNLIKLYQQEYAHPTLKLQQAIQDMDLDFLMSDLQKLINSMRIGAERIRSIVLALRIFSRLDEASMKPVNIHEGIDSTLLILQHRLMAKDNRASIELIKEYGQLPLVTCYASQLNQVFLNLLNNAIDALESQESVVAAQTSHNRQLKANTPQIRICTELTASQTVKIRILDNGAGIEESVLSRLFDPFFTTKPIGQGTGLGLSISYQIVVEKHKGQLTCSSSSKQGTEFTVEIPVRQTIWD